MLCAFGRSSFLGIKLKHAKKIIVACIMMVGAGGLLAQQNVGISPQNVVQLAASGSVEVAQDLLTISMNTTRDGKDGNEVQNQLKAAIEAALTEAKKMAISGELEVRTGSFSLYPRYGRDGKLNGWQGSTELVLEGRDFTRISSTAGKIQTLSVSQVSFSLSREQRAKVENQAQSLAIERFKARATDIAHSFGFGGYNLRDVNVSANDQGYSPRPRLMAMQAKSVMDDAPVPVEAGKTAVVVTVSGSVQLK